MKKIFHVKVDGTVRDMGPGGRDSLTLKQLQEMVGGYVQEVRLPDGSILGCNEEGLLDKLPVNDTISRIWREQFPFEKYPGNNMAFFTGILGDCYLITDREIDTTA